MSSFQELEQVIQEKEQMLMNLGIKTTNEIADSLEIIQMERFNLAMRENTLKLSMNRLRDEEARLLNEGEKNDEKCADISKELKLLYARRLEMSQEKIEQPIPSLIVVLSRGTI